MYPFSRDVACWDVVVRGNGAQVGDSGVTCMGIRGFLPDGGGSDLRWPWYAPSTAKAAPMSEVRGRAAGGIANPFEAGYILGTEYATLAASRETGRNRRPRKYARDSLSTIEWE